MSGDKDALPRPTVAVVDDEVALLKVLEETISAQGYSVSGFTSGAEAIAALREKGFDILLTDLMMPGMSGIELFRKAREIDPDIAGIVMTGHATVQTAIESMKEGVHDYLLKPFKVRALLPILDRAMTVRRLGLENLQLRQTLAMFELGQAVSLSLALGTILDKVADGAMQQCQADEASIMLPTHTSDELYIAAIRGEGRSHLLGHRVSMDKYVAGWVAGQREPVMLQGAVTEPSRMPRMPRREIELAVCLPLLVAGKLVGVMNLNFTRPRRPLSIGELKALSIFGSIAGTALESARMHEEVVAAELKYRRIFEDSTEGLFLTSTDHKRFVTANPAMARILGYDTPQELVETVTDIGTQVFASPLACEEAFRKSGNSGAASALECECLRRDGSRVWVMLSAAPVTDASGGVGCEGHLVDITARKQAEESLSRDRRLLATVIDNIPDSIYLKDRESRFLLANPATVRQLRAASAEELLGKTDFDFHPGDMAERFAAEEKAVLATGKAIVNREERSLGPAGSVTWLLVTKVPLREENGEPWGIVGINRDATDLRTLAHFPEEDPNPVMRVNREGTLLYANPASDALLADWGCRTGMKLPDEYCATASRALDAGTRETVEIQCGKRVYSTTFTPIPDANYLNIYALDVTESRALERQLLQSQKMEAVGRLAGGVAHDFNNLLTVIIGYTDSVLRRLGPEHPASREISEIQLAGQRAASLTRQLLAFGRRQIFEVQVLDLNAIVAGVQPMLQRLMPESISMELLLEPELGRVRADAHQLEQVLLNLLLNASDAMPRGGKLMVETANVELSDEYCAMHVSAKPGSYVRLAVSDTGIGMDAETQAHLFEPFYTTKPTGKGTGLGLSTVYGIVKQSGGNIWVYSEPGKGTAFKIYLPRVFETLEAIPNESPRVELQGGTETILIVEDEEMIRGLIAMTLVEHGFTVLSAGDAEEAAEICAARQGPIHLLLTDVVLPKLSGREGARRLVAARPGMRVLFMSGYTANAIIHHGVLEPGIAFLQKPFAPAVLLRKVREVLDAGKPPAL